MTPAARTLTARYAARLTDICLGVLLATLLIKGATFGSLTSPVFLLTLTVAVVTWLAHVLQLYADTGTLPDQPPAADAAQAARIDALETDVAALQHQAPVPVVPPVPPAVG